MVHAAIIHHLDVHVMMDGQVVIVVNVHVQMVKLGLINPRVETIRLILLLNAVLKEVVIDPLESVNVNVISMVKHVSV
jgi:hypothetical protein